MGVKASSSMRLPMLHKKSIKINKVSSHPFTILVLEISKKIQRCSIHKRDLPHSAPFPLKREWIYSIADYRVGYEIK
jgi:hypothetical protein